MPKPKVGDNVWVDGLKQPNGKIVHIDWYDKEVIVQSHDTGEETPLEWDQFDNFNDQLNQWIVHPN